MLNTHTHLHTPPHTRTHLDCVFCFFCCVFFFLGIGLGCQFDVVGDHCNQSRSEASRGNQSRSEASRAAAKRQSVGYAIQLVCCHCCWHRWCNQRCNHRCNHRRHGRHGRHRCRRSLDAFAPCCRQHHSRAYKTTWAPTKGKSLERKLNVIH